MNWPKATKSGYANLIQSGMSALVALTDTSGYDQAYNRAYERSTRRRNARELRHSGELDIGAAKKRGVKERTAIGLTQDIAEANLRVNAAAAGVGGGSVQAGIAQTGANAAFRTGDQATKEQNEINKALPKVYSGAQGMRLPVDNYDGSLLGDFMQGLGSLDNNFFKDLGLAMELGDEDNSYLPKPVTEDSGFVGSYEGGVTL